MSRRAVAALAASVLILGLVACGGGEDDDETPPPVLLSSDGGGASDGGGTETVDSTPDAPEIPPPDPDDYPGMDERTGEGAEQAFKYYWAVALWGHQTGDSLPISGLHATACVNCQKLVNDIDEVSMGGTYWPKIEITDELLEAESGEPDFEIIVSYVFVTSGHVRTNTGSGGDHEEVEPMLYTTMGGLEWIENRWRVEDLSSLSDPGGDER